MKAVLSGYTDEEYDFDAYAFEHLKQQKYTTAIAALYDGMYSEIDSNPLSPGSEKAFIWYDYAREDGSFAAKMKVADMYYDGEGVKQDREKAFQYYNDITQRYGPAYIWVRLGRCYEEGGDMERDIDKAREHYSEGTFGGDPHAMLALLDMQANGQNIQVDPDTLLRVSGFYADYYFRQSYVGETSDTYRRGFPLQSAQIMEELFARLRQNWDRESGNAALPANDIFPLNLVRDVHFIAYGNLRCTDIMDYLPANRLAKDFPVDALNLPATLPTVKGLILKRI